MKSIKFLSVFAVLAILLFASCSKQAKLERRLEGKWNIDSLNFGVRANGVLDTSTKISKSNAGEISLMRGETNTGSIIFTNSGSIETHAINKWTNTENQLTIVDVAVNYTDTMVFDIISNQVNRQVWKSSHTTTTGGVTFVEELSYKVSRIKQ